jgi:GxxExxY protein
MSEGKLKHFETTDLILKAFFRVYSQLGYGFSERVYENATALACRQLGLVVLQQSPIKVCFDGVLVGEYVADFVVNSLVSVELKAVNSLAEEHEAQLLNYLKATWYEVGLLLNFGSKPQHKRKVFDNSLKGSSSWHKAE